MNHSQPVIPKERNPLTRLKHQRETFWQITFPFILAVLVVVGLAVIIIVMGFTQSQVRTTWADISIIWLVLPGLAVILLLAICLAFVAYGLGRLIGILPGYAYLVQNFFFLVQTRVRHAANQMVKPVISVSEIAGALQALWKKDRAEKKSE